jgi:predicted aspartyl protease
VDTGFDGYLAVNKEATKKLRVTPKGTIGPDPSRMRTLENRYLLRGVGYAS